MRESPSRKDLGSYYTPAAVVRTLVSWVRERGPGGPVLDPSCWTERFLAGLEDAVGVDVDPVAAAEASRRVDGEIVTADFFEWPRKRIAGSPPLSGNPPFIRYQRFRGQTRRRALDYCAAQGVRLSGLCSSWAPFVVAASSLLKRGDAWRSWCPPKSDTRSTREMSFAISSVPSSASK